MSTKSRLVEIDLTNISNDEGKCAVCKKVGDLMIFMSQCSTCKTSVMCCDVCYDSMYTREKMNRICDNKCTSCIRNEKIDMII